MDISDLIGKSFVENGRGPDSYDCYGLCIEIARRRGIILPEQAYCAGKEKDVIIKSIAENEFIELNHPQPWCIVLFRELGPFVGHAGTVLHDCIRFIHIGNKFNAAIERLDSLLWSQRIEGFYRHKSDDHS